jgi:type IV pilus assembly protein PilC
MAISINQNTPKVEAGAFSAEYASAKPRGSIGLFRPRLKAADRIFFSSQLALMLEIGTSVNDALKALRDQIENPHLSKAVSEMLKDVEEGRQLSESMKNHPWAFDDVFVSMVRAGESGGFLKKTLDRIVEMEEKRQALLTQVRATLTYPAILCILGIIVVVFILVGVLPKFTVFFEGQENILPVTTKVLLILSDSLRHFWWIYLPALAAMVLCFKLYKESEQGQVLLDYIRIQAPLFSNLMNKIYTCSLLRTLGSLIENQVPLIEALDMTRGTVKNRYFREFVDHIREHVEQGGKLSQPFSQYPYIMPSVKQMVATGEETGNLSEVMLRLAGFYDNEIEHELKALSSMIEPLALIVMGGMVGIIVSAVILPMFRLAQALH